MDKWKEFFEIIIESFIMAFVIVQVLTNFVLFPVEVNGSSMEPTLTEGQHGFSIIFTRKLGINRFDTVVIDTDQSDDLLVKRVIGLPGETVEYRDNNLYIDGIKMEEDFLKEGTITNDFVMDLQEDEYCCLGDNRSVSRDSRYYGAFKDEEIVTTHILVTNPLTDLGYRK